MLLIKPRKQTVNEQKRGEMLMAEDRVEFMYYLGKAFPKLERIELVILAAYGEGLYAAKRTMPYAEKKAEARQISIMEYVGEKIM